MLRGSSGEAEQRPGTQGKRPQDVAPRRRSPQTEAVGIITWLRRATWKMSCWGPGRAGASPDIPGNPVGFSLIFTFPNSRPSGGHISLIHLNTIGSEQEEREKIQEMEFYLNKHVPKRIIKHLYWSIFPT